jgi:hypothetical protein
MVDPEIWIEKARLMEPIVLPLAVMATVPLGGTPSL